MQVQKAFKSAYFCAQNSNIFQEKYTNLSVLWGGTETSLQ